MSLCEYRLFTVPESFEGRTLQSFLGSGLGLTARQISRLKFKEDGIFVNGVRARTSKLLKTGEEVRIKTAKAWDDGYAKEHLEHMKAGDAPQLPEILYEDDDILAFNKPAGLSVHHGKGHFGDTLADAVTSSGLSDRYYTVGRLDKDTSGVIVCGRSAFAAADVKVEKTYLALVEGCPGQTSGRLEQPLYKNGIMKQSAVTHWELLDAADAPGDFPVQKFSLLKVSIETGRMHQIRKHMALSGMPLAGDTLYGGHIFQDKNGVNILERAALHCMRAQIKLPFHSKIISISAKIPSDMLSVWTMCRNYKNDWINTETHDIL